MNWPVYDQSYFDLCFIYTAAVSTCSEVANLARFGGHVNILIQEIIQVFSCILPLYIIYDWITIIIGHSEHITTLPPHNGHFLLSPRWSL